MKPIKSKNNKNYGKTKLACYLGFVTQAISAELSAPRSSEMFLSSRAIIYRRVFWAESAFR